LDSGPKILSKVKKKALLLFTRLITNIMASLRWVSLMERATWSTLRKALSTTVNLKTGKLMARELLSTRLKVPHTRENG